MPDLLLDHFYTLDSLNKEGDSITVKVTFHAAHAIFNGHFPDTPVVPGVCQTQMLGEILSRAYGIGFMLSSAASIKFLSIIDPSVQPSVIISIAATEKSAHTYAVSSQYTWEGKVFFKFKGTYTTAA
jgi:3-hydroxyacyl-[acyl-carrier-protein] dehydratase